MVRCGYFKRLEVSVALPPFLHARYLPPNPLAPRVALVYATTAEMWASPTKVRGAGEAASVNAGLWAL